jgi:transcriptional regulator GlxA family with amidase domain
MIRVGIVIYQQIQALDLAGALDCFGQANQELTGSGRAYLILLLAARAASTNGTLVNAEPI